VEINATEWRQTDCFGHRKLKWLNRSCSKILQTVIDPVWYYLLFTILNGYARWLMGAVKFLIWLRVCCLSVNRQLVEPFSLFTGVVAVATTPQFNIVRKYIQNFSSGQKIWDWKTPILKEFKDRTQILNTRNLSKKLHRLPRLQAAYFLTYDAAVVILLWAGKWQLQLPSRLTVVMASKKMTWMMDWCYASC